MKTYLSGLVAATALFAVASTQAQPGGMGSPRGPQINAAMAKLFGENSAFSSDVEVNVNMSEGQSMILPGKTAYDSGKSRFEINLAEAKGNAMPPGTAEQMKTMGMDRMIMISRPDKKLSYMVYPGLQAYAEQQMSPAEAAGADADFKVETTELGKETVDGRSTTKNKSVVTDKEGKKHEFTTWNASDLKNFPVQIETTEQGVKATMTFKNLKLSKPEAAQFDPPSGLKKYDNYMAMIQQEMMKRMGGGAGGAPGGE